MRSRSVVVRRQRVIPFTLPPAGPRVVRDEGAPVAAPDRATGWTVVGEYLLVDAAVARRVDPGSRTYAVCQALAELGACGRIEGTLVVDVLEIADAADRRYVLDPANWPEAA